MSADAEAASPVATTTWPTLTPLERRVLGVLVEKAKTTPDAYPMSVNALVAGCNQKSNRDPVLDLNEQDVEQTLTALQQKGLAIKITGGRVVRWRHNLYDSWRLEKVELAVLAELLLRGAQTEGELRGRASRMEPIADLEALRSVLRPMGERRLIVYLSPEARRGTVLTHGFHSPEELTDVSGSQRRDAALAVPSTASNVTRAPVQADSMDSIKADLAEARRDISELRESVTELRHKIDRLAETVDSAAAAAAMQQAARSLSGGETPG